MTLSAQLAEVIFAKLAITYGKHFPDQYQGIPPEQIKAHWAHELDGVSEHAIRYALDNLPRDWPPNVLQFRELCKAAPRPMRQAIPPPRGGRMQPQVHTKLDELKRAFKTMERDVLAGARSLREKERMGILLTRAQKEFWRTALHHEMHAEQLAKEPPLEGQL